ncbi:MAG: oleate hydratase, partial [Flavobacterium sp.]
MSSTTSKFDKLLNGSQEYGNVNHKPDSSKEVQINTPEKTMPFSDQIGNYQRNKGIPSKSYKDSKIYIVGSGIAGMAAAYYFI